MMVNQYNHSEAVISVPNAFMLCLSFKLITYTSSQPSIFHIALVYSIPASPYFSHLFHSPSQILGLLPCPNPPVLPTQSTKPLAYSMGTPPPRSGILHVPVFIIAFLNNLPPSPTPTLSSSHAAAIALYCLSNSRSRPVRTLEVYRDQARLMVQCLKERLREKRRGRGVRVAGWWRKWRIRAGEDVSIDG